MRNFFIFHILTKIDWMCYNGVMITNYELTIDRKLVESRKIAKDDSIDFVQILAPLREEIGEISETFHFPFDYIGGILDDYENARFETDENGNTLLLLQYPALSDAGEIATYPYTLIVTSSKSIIFALNHTVNIDQIFTRTYEKKHLDHQIIFDIISQMTINYHHYLEEFRKKRHKIATHIQKSTRNDQLLDMIQIQASLVYFQDALENNLEVLKRYIDYLKKYGEDGFAERIFDLYIETDQAKTETKIQAKLLENLRDLFSNIVANNLNIVMKIMTSATFVLGIPAVIFGFYGINVPLPGQKLTWIVWPIIGVTFVICGFVSWILRKKDMM